MKRTTFTLESSKLINLTEENSAEQQQMTVAFGLHHISSLVTFSQDHFNIILADEWQEIYTYILGCAVFYSRAMVAPCWLLA
jgi:hypothetical protein